MGFEWVPGKNYKRHYICLNCQKGFKRSSEKDMKYPVSNDLSNLMEEYYASEIKQDIIAYLDKRYQKLKVVCPNCQNSMIQVHYDFEVPPQRDSKLWKRLQKEMSVKTKDKYDTYIQWHRIALLKESVRSVKYKVLKQNLTKLERLKSIDL